MPNTHHISTARPWILEIQRGAVLLSKMVLQRTGYSLEKQVRVEWESGEIPWEEEGRVGAWLAEHLRAFGRVDGNGIVCLPRTWVCSRILEFPTVASDQLPNLVALQAESHYGDSWRDQEYDYVSLPVVPSDRRQRVLLLTVAKSNLAALRAVMKQAKLTPGMLTLGELADGYTSLLGRNMHRLNALTRTATLRADRLDVALGYGDLSVLLQSMPYPADSELQPEVIQGMLNRMQASLPVSLSELTSQQDLLVVESGYSGDSERAEELAHLLKFDLVRRSRQELIAGWATRSHRRIDFQNPNRPRGAGWFRKGLLVATLAMLLAGGGMLYRQVQQTYAQRDSELQSTLREVKRLEGELAVFARDEAGLRVMDEWNSKKVDWHRELGRLVDRMGDEPTLYVSRLQMEVAEGEAIPVMRMDGQAKSAQRILEWNRSFLDAPDRYWVQPHGIEPTQLDPEFGSQFRLEIGVLPEAKPAQDVMEVDDESQ